MYKLLCGKLCFIKFNDKMLFLGCCTVLQTRNRLRCRQRFFSKNICFKISFTTNFNHRNRNILAFCIPSVNGCTNFTLCPVELTFRLHDNKLGAVNSASVVKITTVPKFRRTITLVVFNCKWSSIQKLQTAKKTCLSKSYWRHHPDSDWG